jgi:hypothetical protein
LNFQFILLNIQLLFVVLRVLIEEAIILQDVLVEIFL